jgi:hypothetical protein
MWSFIMGRLLRTVKMFFKEWFESESDLLKGYALPLRS